MDLKHLTIYFYDTLSQEAGSANSVLILNSVNIAYM